MASDSPILTWSITNWITVILMAAIGFTLIGLGMKFYQSRAKSSS